MKKNKGCYVLYRINYTGEVNVSVYKDKTKCYNQMHREMAEEADDLSASGYLYQTESDINGGRVTANYEQIYYEWYVYQSELH